MSPTYSNSKMLDFHTVTPFLQSTPRRGLARISHTTNREVTVCATGSRFRADFVFPVRCDRAAREATGFQACWSELQRSRGFIQRINYVG